MLHRDETIISLPSRKKGDGKGDSEAANKPQAPFPDDAGASSHRTVAPLPERPKITSPGREIHITGDGL